MCAPPRRKPRRSGVAVVLLLVFAGGCGGPAEEPLAPPPPRSAAERFESLMKALRDYVGDQASQARVAGDYAADPMGPVANADFTVEEEYRPPADGAEGPHLATVCFITRSSVTVTLPPTEPAERKDISEERSKQLEELGEGLEGIADLDSLIVPSPEALGERIGASPTVEIENDETRTCYELEFRDGKWVALTELDRTEQPFYALAVEYALRRQ